MTKYVPIETIKYHLSKIRKSSNFQYQQAIDRNKRNQVKQPPLANLLLYLRNKNVPEPKIDEIVKEYWLEVEKNKSFEKEIASKLKIRYSKFG